MVKKEKHPITRGKIYAGFRRTKTATCFFQTYRWLERDRT